MAWAREHRTRRVADASIRPTDRILFTLCEREPDSYT